MLFEINFLRNGLNNIMSFTTMVKLLQPLSVVGQARRALNRLKSENIGLIGMKPLNGCSNQPGATSSFKCTKSAFGGLLTVEKKLDKLGH